MGLPEITIDGQWACERGNLIGAAAQVRTLFRVPLPELQPAALGKTLP